MYRVIFSYVVGARVVTEWKRHVKADELSAVARSVGAPPTDLYLREMASETNVKRATLADYKVVYFATHGLVAGDVKGSPSHRWLSPFPCGQAIGTMACSPPAKSLS